MKKSFRKRGTAMVVLVAGLLLGGCVGDIVAQNRKDELRRQFGSGQISSREYQQQLEQMERAKAEAAAAERKQ